MTEIRDLIPSDPLMAGPWFDCALWASQQPDIMSRFQIETGNNYSPPKTGLDAMIADATGADRAFAVSFLTWFNENLWGDADLPAGGDAA